MATQWIKKPKTRGQSWIILEREGQKSKKFSSPALEALNLAWSQEQISAEEAELKCREIIKQIRKKKEKLSVFNSVNARAVEQYWDAEYAHRLLVDPDGMKRSLISAANDVGHLSLLVATRAELQQKINEKYFDNPEKHRRTCSRLNQLLKYLKRDFKLILAKPENPEVNYINEIQLKQLLMAIQPEYRPIIATLFYTGMRIGETFVFQIKSEGVIRVEKQLDDKGRVRAVKNRRPRTVAVDMAGWNYVVECHRLMQERFYPRNKDFRKIVNNASQKLFTDKRHHIVAHDLRHSFAIHMLNKGCSITEIALLLGDSVAVANQYYVGFVATDETIKMIQDKLKPEPVAEEAIVLDKEA